MKTLRKICSIFAVLSFTVYFVSADVAPMPIKAEKKTKDYIICTQSEQQVKSLEKEYQSSGEINENGEELLQENHMTSVQMTEREAKELKEEAGVCFVEEDIVVKASAHVSKKIHEKKVKKIKENKSENEWNIRMIRSDKVKKSDSKRKKKDKTEKVKIAVLDSGVDWGNDIDVAETITLVPGEEEMSPLFMDGTGHGDSVAGLIAAKDNGEGITGVNPNAEIYSIRVLDDENAAPVSRVIEGIYKAIEWDVNIINMSFGVSEYSEALKMAIQDAEKAGILVIAAAGNTGESGVQYPAAFDEVIAVGSVDKYGEVVESSAKGEELELVAPGELVRSTGFFESELVESGTSLAAPQVAGVASLIWEKDLDVSADFVRALLRESANAYGEADAYGNGLVDAEYALENYEAFKKQYQENVESTQIEENEKEVLCFGETSCVEGCWKKNEHAAMIHDAYVNVKKGARFPDTEDYYIEGTNVLGKKNYVFAGMGRNPWWHGYYQKAEKDKQENMIGEYKNNYVACYIYITRLANQLKSGKTALVPNGITDTIKNQIKGDIGRIEWQRQYGDTPTKGEKRAFVWGMAIHSLTDTFAHSAYNVSTKKVIKHTESDKVEYKPTRLQHAKKAALAAMEIYKLGEIASGTFSQYSAVKNATEYKLVNLEEYMTQVAGANIGTQYKSVSKTKGLSK